MRHCLWGQKPSDSRVPAPELLGNNHLGAGGELCLLPRAWLAHTEGPPWAAALPQGSGMQGPQVLMPAPGPSPEAQ